MLVGVRTTAAAAAEDEDVGEGATTALPTDEGEGAATAAARLRSMISFTMFESSREGGCRRRILCE